jgi:hypothetical protein
MKRFGKREPAFENWLESSPGHRMLLTPTTEGTKPTLAHFLPKTVCFPHSAQAAQRVTPTLCLGRGRLLRVLLGRSSSLRALRRRWTSVFVLGHFVGTTRSSDSPPTCMLDFWLITFSSRPDHYFVSGIGRASRFSRVEFPGMQGSQTPQSPMDARLSRSSMLPSARGTASAL